VELAIGLISGAGSVIAVAIVLYLMHHSALGAEHEVADAMRERVKVETKLGECAARISLLEGKLLAATTSAESWKQRATEQEQAANEMSEALLGSISQLPASGARDRVLSRWARPPAKPGSGSATVSGHAPVSVPSGPATPGPDDLEKPE
jgi:phytoene dehydrogenase-like protein